MMMSGKLALGEDELVALGRDRLGAVDDDILRQREQHHVALAGIALGGIPVSDIIGHVGLS